MVALAAGWLLAGWLALRLPGMDFSLFLRKKEKSIDRRTLLLSRVEKRNEKRIKKKRKKEN